MPGQDSSPPPPPTSAPSGSGEPVNGRPSSSAAAGTGQASSPPRYRYSDPFPMDVGDQTVTTTGRLVLREPPPPAGQPHPLLLFMEVEDRRYSSAMHRLRNSIDGSLRPVIVHRLRVEQLWMEFQELAGPNQQASTSYRSGESPSFVNVPPPPSFDAGTSSPSRFRFGEPFPIIAGDQRVTMTGWEVHMVPPTTAAGRRRPALLYVEILQPISETYQIEDNGVRLVIFRHIHAERLFLEARREPNQNRSDQPSSEMNPTAARGTNVGPSNQTDNGSENVNGSQQDNARAGNSGVRNVVEAAVQEGPLISNQTTGTDDHPSTSNQTNNESGSLSYDQNQAMDGDDDAPAGDN